MGNVVKVLGALEALSDLQADAELKHAGDGPENGDCLFASNMLFRSLQYGLAVAMKLMEEERATVKPTAIPKCGESAGGA